MCQMCGFDCGYDGFDCMTDEEFYDQTPVGIDVVTESGLYESEVSMSDKVEVEVVEEKGKIIKKQSEVWVYDDEVYATYEKAAAAKLKTKISEPLIRAYYKRSGNYTESQLKGYIAQATVSKTFLVYLEDVVKVLPEIVAAIEKSDNS